MVKQLDTLFKEVRELLLQSRADAVDTIHKIDEILKEIDKDA